MVRSYLFLESWWASQQVSRLKFVLVWLISTVWEVHVFTYQIESPAQDHSK